MTILIEIGLGLGLVVLLIPSLVLLVECTAALLPRRSCGATQEGRPRVTVLIPAHDEAGVIRAAIESVHGQLKSGDRLMVVADNCQDDTAAIASQAGAEVIVRDEPERQGKGYALQRGLDQLESDPPQVLVMLDADCLVADGAIEALVQAAATTQRPVQARYLFQSPARPDPMDSVSAFACLVKNVVRPTGLDNLGLPCPLVGSGMAFPWPLIRSASFAGDNLVEDLQLGLDLALSGHPPLYCYEAVVSTHLPKNPAVRSGQRRRWEHGHLATILSQVPRLVARAFRAGNAKLLAMALDLCVPPLSLLVLLVAVLLGLSVLAGLLGCSWIPTILGLVALFLVAAAIVEAWIRFGRSQFPWKMALAIPWYALRKVPIYIGFLIRRQKAWVRTEREPPGGSTSDDQ
ncbi:MAG: glycosyltransferase [Bradymonadales bacterium]|nr:glycosyltransferase [Bradymonadales bacterium]